MTSSPFEPFARTAVRAYAQRQVRRHVALDLRGLEHLPPAGPVLLAARHYHHLYDGLILLGCLPRPVHLFVAADWARSRLTRRALELACATARWPMVLRPDNMRRLAATGSVRQRSAFSPNEVGGYLRRALRDGAALLREGRVLAVFPEGYPNIDLRGSRKPGPDDFLPFQPGFLHLVELARRQGAGPVPIVPVGFDYADSRGCEDADAACAAAPSSFCVTMALGEPVYMCSPAQREAVLRSVAERVRALSAGASVAETADSGSVEAAS